MDKFSYEANGYNRKEVNQFIGDVIVQTESIIERVKSQNTEIEKYTNAISYSYDLNLNIYREIDGEILKVNPSTVMDNLGMGMNAIQTKIMNTNVFQELFSNQEINEQMYDVVKGRWPKNYDEIVISVDKNNQIADYVLYSLGMLDQEELSSVMNKMLAGQEIEEREVSEFSYDDFLNLELKVLQNSDYYQKSNNLWLNKENDSEYIKSKLNNALTLKVVGIIKPDEEAAATGASGLIYYTNDLTKYIINKNNESEIVKEQKSNPEINILTNLEFSDNTSFDVSQMTPEQLAYFQSLSTQELAEFMQNYQSQAGMTYDQVLQQIGGIDLENPSMINIYPKDFDSKESIIDYIGEYNDKQENEEDVIEYQDIVGALMSSVSTIIDIISYALMAFVSISLIVSSIMIGIITYISVLERTKEIGILRAIGASKKDITRIFNAETVIEGFIAGVFGVLVTLILNIPINIIIKDITGISNLSVLPIVGAIFLIILSTILTIVGGFIPAIFASKKDPVEALRTE